MALGSATILSGPLVKAAALSARKVSNLAALFACKRAFALKILRTDEM